MTPPTRWRFEATGAPTQLRTASDALDAILAARGASERSRLAARLVCEEIVLNAFQHGGASFVIAEADPAKDPAALTFEDDGAAFDPAAPPGPRASDVAGEASTRGRGLILVRAFTTQIEHRRSEGRNRLRVLLVE